MTRRFIGKDQIAACDMFSHDDESSSIKYRRRMKRMIEALSRELTLQGIIGQGTTTDLRVDIISLAKTALMVCDFDKVAD
ncbi:MULTISPECIES: hypothetical protein [Bradyrhizobium]|uniref:Uncharacterized protein n=1 Tax=Bradyrhizobium elkanii TaxID=29448 RepID=A0A8I1Y6Y8_BRAEL|nr:MULTISPECIES: hypothetical protein [Bradyrhizobium]MBP1291228.1 hypothetical protein [Bradyrhizobium elkanii]MCP1928458.1 hypothetical protein [Bradyrhizobium elkanii]MCP1973051.1 hypothetical protein [Bradyrhizobium elkanii]MCS3580928.1 hypothetical protein [Bradyrhizobium elkanii]MCS3723804.1 hypothetical protein [Bradyrhizobium elkanii]